MKFTSIYGQDTLKLGIILNAINSKIGGVLLTGDRGSGKSTSIRAIRRLLPWIWSVKNSKLISFSSPFVELPLGATEDRICGAIDIEHAFQRSKKVFERGLLAKCDRGFLYVDEINLLDDHLVDLLLDSSASGWNTVEREGISVQHTCDFVLVGSCNKEEGELRPQLLDRFGLNIEVSTPKQIRLRQAIVEQVLGDSFDAKSYNFDAIVAWRLKSSKNRIVHNNFKQLISNICIELDINGLRGDLSVHRARCALAAWCGRNFVSLEDIKTVLPLCLRHRLRRDPLSDRDRIRVMQVFNNWVE